MIFTTMVRFKSLFILSLIINCVIQSTFTYNPSPKKHTHNSTLFDNYRSSSHRNKVGNYYKYLSNFQKQWTTEKSGSSKYYNEQRDDILDAESEPSALTHSYQWQMSEWSECSVTCGTGIQTRNVNCVNIAANSTPNSINSAHCPQPMPLTVQNCKITDNCHIKPKWRILSEWSECSVSCGKGTQKRIVCCFIEDIQVRDKHCDAQTKPACEQQCEVECKQQTPQTSLTGNAHTISNGQWLISPWSNQCSNDCGYGVEKRRVICYGSDNCDPLTKPTDERSCCSSIGCSRVKWFHTDWSKCSSSCGTGIEKRDVVCMKLMNGSVKWHIVDDNQCPTEDKPLPLHRSCVAVISCAAEWYVSDWSTECLNGLQSRSVLCLDDKQQLMETCSRHDSPATSKSCADVCVDNSIYSVNQNTANNKQNEVSAVVGSESQSQHSTQSTQSKHNNDITECRDELPNCNFAKAANLCSYQYYRRICCASCV